MYLGLLVRDDGPADRLAEDSKHGFPELAKTTKEYGPSVAKVVVTAKTGNPALGEVASHVVRKVAEAWEDRTKKDS
jgi:hypothetical protein